MKISGVEENKGIYMFTSVKTPKVEEIQHNQLVGLTLQDSSRWVSITGRAEIVRDKAKMAELFEEGLKPWFPQGLETPDIGLIKLVPEGGEYWDNGKLWTKISFAFELGRAYITGTRADTHSASEVHKVAL